MFRFIPPSSRVLPVEHHYFSDLEDRYQIHLPEMYKHYYRSHNGCEICRSVFSVNGSCYTVAGMLPLRYGYMNAERIKDMFRYSPIIPRAYFPLAVSLDGDNYFLDTETGEVLLFRNCRRCETVTSSLEAFFALMSEYARHEEKEL